MKTSEFSYELPKELIAQRPAERREDSRLMVVDRRDGKLFHCRFRDVTDFLTANDLCVLNDTRVFPARLYAHKKGHDRQIEVLLLKEVKNDLWEVLIRPARRVRPGVRLVFEEGEFEANVMEGNSPAKRLLYFEYSGCLLEWIHRIGYVPLPPYISRNDRSLEDLDRERYQTVYAKEARSVAAPTAGLHFTRRLLEKIRHCAITLHVGYGTFKPITEAKVEDHQMEAEFYVVDEDAARLIQKEMEAGHRVIAVGTSTTRTLEHVYSTRGKLTEDSGYTDLYIYPGYEFKIVQGLLTNFHLPGSTLLVLVAAFTGKELTRQAYQEAIRKRYRFYSYGDAMLIL